MALPPNMVTPGLDLDDTEGLPDVEIPIDAPEEFEGGAEVIQDGMGGAIVQALMMADDMPEEELIPFDANLADAGEFQSVVIPDRTQYRIFFTKTTVAQNATKGVICVLKGQTFEFAETRGIRPASTDSFVKAGDVIVLHGDFSNGYVYRQESGNTFDGTAILAKYRSPDMTFGDAGIRKHMQRVIVNYAPESTLDADLFVRYDYESKDSARPAAYELDSADIAAVYGTATYGSGSSVTGTYGGASQPLLRQSVEGSGFAVALRVNDGGETAPYSLKGFQLEYQLGARR